MLIRPETPADTDMTHDLTQAAFAPKTFSNNNEGPIIDAMRDAGDLVLSLVAQDAGTIIGHVAFSPAQISKAAGDWYGLGPISVREDRHVHWRVINGTPPQGQLHFAPALDEA